MKTEEEVGRHRNDLLAGIRLPCSCAGSGHSKQCHTGMLMMRAVADTLSWAMGEKDEMQVMVDKLRARVGRVTGSN